jgi:hypothetical protein
MTFFWNCETTSSATANDAALGCNGHLSRNGRHLTVLPPARALPHTYIHISQKKLIEIPPYYIDIPMIAKPDYNKQANKQTNKQTVVYQLCSSSLSHPSILETELELFQFPSRPSCNSILYGLYLPQLSSIDMQRDWQNGALFQNRYYWDSRGLFWIHENTVSSRQLILCQLTRWRGYKLVNLLSSVCDLKANMAKKARQMSTGKTKCSWNVGSLVFLKVHNLFYFLSGNSRSR